MLLAKLHHVIQGGGGEVYTTKKISLYVFELF